jgi:hypothetical protein
MRFPEIDDLRDLERPDLQALWLRLFKQSAPLKMHRQVMVSLLAYRLQERKEGGLSTSAVVQLSRALRNPIKLGHGSSAAGAGRSMR